MRALPALAIVVVACSAPAVTEWNELATMKVARSEHPAVVVGGEIVVIGGLITTGIGRTSVTATVEAYDPGSDAWRSLPDLPSPRHHLMAAVVDDRMFAIGGYSEAGFTAADDVWELVGGVWEPRAPMPRPVGAGAAVVAGAVIYVVGGAPDGGLFTYDPDIDTWTELAAPGELREHVAAAVHEGEIWAMGGRWQGRILSSTEIYEPGTDTWRTGPGMNEERSGFGATVHDGSVHVAGGEVFAPDRALASVERLDPNDGWVQSEPLPFGLHGIPLVSDGSALFVPGGSVRPGGVDNPGTMLSLAP